MWHRSLMNGPPGTSSPDQQHTADPGTQPRTTRDPVTTLIAALLGLVAVAGTLFCLGYAAWWLLTYWNPA